MKNNNVTDKIITKIINSKSFGHSNTYANLLLYLVASTQREDVPKETTIAAEILGKPNFDPSQSTLVRVYIYNLRKKLIQYYAKEGKDDTIILQIPKGSYEVRFVEKKILAPKEAFYNFKVIALALFILLILSLAYNVVQYPDKHDINPISENGLWKDLFLNQKPLMVLLGDLFIYLEENTETATKKTIRNPDINSLEDYESFILKQPESNLIYEPLGYSLLIYNSVLWIKDLSEIFSHDHSDFTIRNMVRFNPKELPDNNFIVIGMMKTFGLFKDYLQSPTIFYNSEDQSIVYHNGQEGSETVFRPYGDPNGHHTDYGFITKVPGPNNNNIYLFGGIWDTAASQSLKYFTSPKLHKELESALIKKYGKLPQYYQIVLEVKGVDRMELSSKILIVEEFAP